MTDDRAREQHLRRVASQHGYVLRKLYVTDPADPSYGRWVVGDGKQGLRLEMRDIGEVERFLARAGR